MLSKANEKNVYEKLICAAISVDPIEEIPTGYYDGSICVAAMGVGRISAQALDEMRRHIRPGEDGRRKLVAWRKFELDQVQTNSSQVEPSGGQMTSNSPS